jgi:hypothetical protein
VNRSSAETRTVVFLFGSFEPAGRIDARLLMGDQHENRFFFSIVKIEQYHIGAEVILGEKKMWEKKMGGNET